MENREENKVSVKFYFHEVLKLTEIKWELFIALLHAFEFKQSSEWKGARYRVNACLSRKSFLRGKEATLVNSNFLENILNTKTLLHLNSNINQVLTNYDSKRKIKL